MGELEVRPRETEAMLGSTSVGPKAKRNTSSMVPQVNATVKYMFSMLLQIEQCRRFGMTIVRLNHFSHLILIQFSLCVIGFLS